jgi:hypothetical protein
VKSSKKSTVSHADLKHGKRAEDGMHMSALAHKGSKGGKHMGKVDGYIDDTKPTHIGAKFEMGSRGPFTSTSKGKSKKK